MYEGILVDVAFAGFFLAKVKKWSRILALGFNGCFIFQWLGKQSFLDDLSSLDPDLYNGLVFLKHYSGNLEDLSLNFTVAIEGKTGSSVFYPHCCSSQPRIWRHEKRWSHAQWQQCGCYAREPASLYPPCITLSTHQTNQAAERGVLWRSLWNDSAELVEVCNSFENHRVTNLWFLQDV